MNRYWLLIKTCRPALAAMAISSSAWSIVSTKGFSQKIWQPGSVPPGKLGMSLRRRGYYKDVRLCHGQKFGDRGKDGKAKVAGACSRARPQQSQGQWTRRPGCGSYAPPHQVPRWLSSLVRSFGVSASRRRGLEVSKATSRSLITPGVKAENGWIPTIGASVCGTGCASDSARCRMRFVRMGHLPVYRAVTCRSAQPRLRLRCACAPRHCPLARPA